MTASDKVKITYVINTLSVGGAERGMARLLHGIDANIFDVTVVALDGRSRGVVNEVPDHVSLVDLEVSSYTDVIRLRRLWTEIRGADVLVTSMFHATQLGRLFGTLQRTPVVLSWQHSETLGTPTRQFVTAKLSALDDLTLGDSQKSAAGIDQCGTRWTQVQEVPIAGVNLDEYQPTPTDTDSGPIRVGALGRLTPAKNFTAVLDVAQRLSDREIQFHIGGDGPLADDLRSKVAEQGIENVRFEGFVDDVVGFLTKCDVYFQPSVREGLCLTVVEAMACGLPVVGSDVGGIPEAVVHGETGYVEPSEDTEAFAERIETLAASSERRQAMGDRGRERVRESYSRERLVKEFYKILAECGIDLPATTGLSVGE